LPSNRHRYSSWNSWSCWENRCYCFTKRILIIIEEYFSKPL
jgi:hypothetical protein